MIFINHAFSGCEMYQDFIDRLSNDYNCIGIDNYNIYNEDKIDNLSKLSSFYINQLNLSKNETVYMFGWSLGGVIAIEMSYQLER